MLIYIYILLTSHTLQASGLKQGRLGSFQLLTLQKYFSVNPYPSAIDKKEIAAKLGLETERVKNWFNNERGRISSKTTNSGLQFISIFVLCHFMIAFLMDNLKTFITDHRFFFSRVKMS